MAGEHETIIVYGTPWYPDCRRAKQFLGEQRLHYYCVVIEQGAASMAYVESATKGMRRITAVVLSDGSILIEPSNADIATKLGSETQAKLTCHDVIMVGGGPAGL